MVQKFIHFLIVLCFPLASANAADWIGQQIEQDLQYLAEHPTTSSSLMKRFVELKQQSSRMLYAKIRNNQWIWESKIEEGENYKKIPVQKILEELATTHLLPDTDMLICLEDGIAGECIPFEPDSCKEVVERPYLLRGEQIEPIFAVSKVKNLKNVFLIPDWYYLQDRNNQEQQAALFKKAPSWEKKKPVAFFRGSCTGRIDKSLQAFGNLRLQLMLFSRAHPEVIDAGITQLDSWRRASYTACKAWYKKQIGKYAPYVSKNKQCFYKYLLDADGHAASYERCRWILLSPSTLVKIEGDFEQWYYKALIPWQHFVPIQHDLSDLEMNIIFLKKHDAIAQQIAEEGRKLGEDILSADRTNQYIYRLLWAYSQYVTLDELKD